MNKKILLASGLLAGATLSAGLAVVKFGPMSQDVSAAMPPKACSNIAVKIDERVQKFVSQTPYPSPINQINPCNNGVFEPADYYYDPSWSGRYKRYIFGDGSIMGSIYQGYMGGKVTSYAVCADGRAKVNGRSSGYWGMGSTQEICNTL